MRDKTHGRRTTLDGASRTGVLHSILDEPLFSQNIDSGRPPLKCRLVPLIRFQIAEPALVVRLIWDLRIESAHFHFRTSQYSIYEKQNYSACRTMPLSANTENYCRCERLMTIISLID